MRLSYCCLQSLAAWWCVYGLLEILLGQWCPHFTDGWPAHLILVLKWGLYTTFFLDYGIVHPWTRVGEILLSNRFTSPVCHLFSRLDTSKCHSDRASPILCTQANTQWASLHQIMKDGAETLWERQHLVMSCCHCSKSSSQQPSHKQPSEKENKAGGRHWALWIFLVGHVFLTNCRLQPQLSSDF